jgi:hypothetical protein
LYLYAYIFPFSGGSTVLVLAAASRNDAAPTSFSRSLCNAQQQHANDKATEIPPSSTGNVPDNSSACAAPAPGSASAAAVDDAALSVAAAAAAEASAAAAAAVSAALDAANAIPSPGPSSDPATNTAAAAEVIHSSGLSGRPSPLDSNADAVAQLQQHAQVLVGVQEQVSGHFIVDCVVCRSIAAFCFYFICCRSSPLL